MNNKIDIKSAVKGIVTFRYYKDGALWYATENAEVFSVPIDDIGNATFNAVDKGILFMRYMRKWNDQLNKKETE